MIMQRQTAKEKIITAAQQLMEGQGYTATTVDKIVETAGVAKGSFYHAFKSKEALALTAVEDYFRRGMGIVSAGVVDEPDPIRRLFGFLDYVEEKSTTLWEHGCLLGSITLELANTYPSLIDKVDELFLDMESRVAGLFGPALAEKDIRQPKAEELARHMLVVIEGGIIMSKSHRNTNYLREALRHYRSYIEAILK